MHSSDLGHVPREVWLHAHLLELLWRAIRKRDTFSAPVMSLLKFQKVVCILRCVHGVARSFEVPVLDSDICRFVCYSLDCILHVSYEMNRAIHLLIFFQFRYFDVAEKSFQDADSGHLQMAQGLPSTSMGHRQEPDVHPDSSWVNLPLILIHVPNLQKLSTEIVS